MNREIENSSLADLFRLEVEQHRAALSDGLLALERGTQSPQILESLMRSAHSIKGAARIVNRTAAVELAHAMEDCFVSLQKGLLVLSSDQIDKLLEGVDLINDIASASDDELKSWTEQNREKLQGFVTTLKTWSATPAATPVPAAVPVPTPVPAVASVPREETGSIPVARSLRVTAENLNRLLALAGESRVASRWIDEFAQDMIRLKNHGRKLSQSVSSVRQSLSTGEGRLRGGQLAELEQRSRELTDIITGQIEELDRFDRRFLNLSTRLYDEVLDTRMRPFSDGVQEFSRMARDLGRSLGKEVNLELAGESTPADRDVLEKLEAPITHLLRNAIDHGLELPQDRRQSGKPPVGTVRIEARHSAGMLLVTVSDDGLGIDAESIRRAIVAKKMTTSEVAAKMNEAELFDFLFLPGFTMKSHVTEISGRGVGLDVVQSMVKDVGGRVRVSSRVGRGTSFHLELPLTLSVTRTLLAEIGGEIYALPLSRLVTLQKISSDRIQSVQGRQYFDFDGENVGLVSAAAVLGLAPPPPGSGNLSVVVLGDRTRRYGLIVDAVLSERELVVLPLDPRLGKLRNISAAALLPDRTPVLIVDVDDILRSVESLVSEGGFTALQEAPKTVGKGAQKRILVVDDSLTVRELERKLLDQRGFAVEVAVDGMDGWNAVRGSDFDLVITDVDMPRMDGIELLRLIRKDARLSAMPVMIVSYKDREEDRLRGLEAGASYYLTKASFHDETLLQAVEDLIRDSET